MFVFSPISLWCPWDHGPCLSYPWVPPLDISWGHHGCLLNGEEACCTPVCFVPVLSLVAEDLVAMLFFCLLLLCCPRMAITCF